MQNKTIYLEQARKLIKKFEIEPDSIDLIAFFDATLNWNEQKKVLLEHIGKEDLEQLDLKALEEKSVAENIEREINYTNKVFEKAVETIVKDSNPKLDNYYKLLDSYVDMIIKGYSNSLLIYGNFGLGKSHRVIEELGKAKADFTYFTGAITPLSIYKQLYQNKEEGKILFLDDVGSSIFENNKSIEIIKPALQEVAGKRILNYDSATEKLGGVPKRFEYNGRLIIATNELPDNTLSLRALLNRPLLLELFFTHKELIKIFFIIAKQGYKDTTLEQRMAVVNYLKENVDESCDNLSIRTLLKGFEMIAYNKNEWQQLFKPILKVNDFLKLIIDNETKVRKEQIEMWKERTGMTERTYYKYLKELRKRRGYVVKLNF